MTTPHDHFEPPSADAAGETIDEELGVSRDERLQLVPDLLARRFAGDSRSYWQIVWDDFKSNRFALVSLWVIVGMALLGILAPLVANHRPYLLIADTPVGGFGKGWHYPLFASLRAIDWILLIGVPQILFGWRLVRRARKHDSGVSHTGVGVLVAFGLFPLALAILRLAFDEQTTKIAESTQGLLGKELWWWGIVAFLAVGGTACVVPGLLNLHTDRRDALGNRMIGGAVMSVVFGSVLILCASAMVGTIPVKEIETTDYREVAGRDDVTAIFPPMPHNFQASENFARYQPPFSPRVRVHPSGGSSAASDLGLTDNRREENLVEDLSGFDRLTEETPLWAFRRGAGVRFHEDGDPDFILVSHSLQRYPVTLTGANTLGDVFRRIRAASNGQIVAKVNDAGTRIVFEDVNSRAPLHLLGTDGSGSDVASRIIHATRVALSIGFVSTSIAIVIGIVMGALMGYFGGWVDIVGMRIIEIFMAIPRLFLLLTVIAFIPPAWNKYMLFAMMGVIGAFSWMGAARFIRAEFFRLRSQDFIQSAKACGLPVRSILFKHMLPNGVTPVLVDASFGVAAAIFIETNLSFLGFGIKPPDPSWGKMLSEAVDPASGVFYPWMAICPGIMIFLTVFAFNLIGDALRDAIDPKLRKAAAV